MADPTVVVVEDRDGLPYRFQCPGCIAEWFVPTVLQYESDEPLEDVRQLTLDRIAEHTCAPGVAAADVLRVRQFADELAADLRIGDDDDWEVVIKSAAQEVVVAFDGNKPLLRTALRSTPSGERTPGDMILLYAQRSARQEKTDDERALWLAKLAVMGCSADQFAFRPVHAQLAAGMIPEATNHYLRTISNEDIEPPWEPRFGQQAERWLAEFEQKACGLS